jgi:glutaminyl-peptide cyclotransferase
MIELRYKILIVITIILCACTNEAEQKPPPPPPEVPEEMNSVKSVGVPAFNSDSAYYFIEKQVSFGPRVISSNGWENCGDWLEKKLTNYADTVIIQQSSITTYDGKNHTLKNIISSFSPEKKKRIALFAHWDTRHIADQSDPIIYLPIDGANDGGSGVGVLLEMARQFSLKNPKIGVDIILFDAEDYGEPTKENKDYSKYSRDDLQKELERMDKEWCKGSQYWSKNPHKKNYSAKYGILLDMVAGKNAKFYLEGNSVKFASPVVQKVWKKGHKLGYGKYFIFQETRHKIMDDHVPINNSSLGIPTIDIVEFSPSGNFNKHWHTHQDNMNNIDKETIKAVGQTLLGVVYNE